MLLSLPHCNYCRTSIILELAQVNHLINAVVVDNFDAARRDAAEVDGMLMEKDEQELNEVGWSVGPQVLFLLYSRHSVFSWSYPNHFWGFRSLWRTLFKWRAWWSLVEFSAREIKWRQEQPKLYWVNVSLPFSLFMVCLKKKIRSALTCQQQEPAGGRSLPTGAGHSRNLSVLTYPSGEAKPLSNSSPWTYVKVTQLTFSTGQSIDYWSAFQMLCYHWPETKKPASSFYHWPMNLNAN